MIAYENLKIANMVKHHRLAKSISDAAWGLFLGWVRYYGAVSGVPVMAVPPHFTTQDCSGVLPDGTPCPERVKKALSVRTHVCPRCGLVLDRDANAALNILAAALRTAGQAGTGSLRAANASGQKTSSERTRVRPVKSAG